MLNKFMNKLNDYFHNKKNVVINPLYLPNRPGHGNTSGFSNNVLWTSNTSWDPEHVNNNTYLVPDLYPPAYALLPGRGGLPSYKNVELQKQLSEHLIHLNEKQMKQGMSVSNEKNFLKKIKAIFVG